jgi:hypothetical protein
VISAKRLLGVLLASLALLSLGAAAASAATPGWQITSIADTTAARGSSFEYLLEVVNVGTASSSGQVELRANLPTGLTATELVNAYPSEFSCAGLGVPGPTTVTCSELRSITTKQSQFAESFVNPRLVVSVGEGVVNGSTLTSSFEVSGGGAPAPATTVDPTRIEASPPGFGIDSYDGQYAEADGSPSTQAGGHPDSISTTIIYNSLTNPNPAIGQASPVEAIKDILAEQPPGFIGNPSPFPQCTAADLADGRGISATPLCPVASQLGTSFIRFDGNGAFNTIGPVPVFNMVPPPGVSARFGFSFKGIIVVLDAKLRSDGDYGLTAEGHDISQALSLQTTNVTLWDVPASPAHDSERACPGQSAPSEGGPTCLSEAPEVAFLRNPTSCPPNGEGLLTKLRIDSWRHPGAFVEGGFLAHEAPGLPAAPEEWGPTYSLQNCEEEPFQPGLVAQPTTHEADSPTGLSVDLTMPQLGLEEPGSISESDLRKTEVLLPRGMGVNGSSADGLGACTSAQIGLIGTNFEEPNPIHFTNADPSCPESSKIGTVSLKTPLLEETLKGEVYLAKQGDNPFKSLLAIYLVVKGPGFVIKLPGKVEADSATGQLKTVFLDTPQQPFSDLHMELKGGPRAPLTTPPACGTYTTAAQLTPWSGNAAVSEESSFEITSGPNGSPCPPKPAGFNPKLSAGTASPLAGAFTPLSLRLTREDGTQRLAGLTATLPPGLIGKLAGIPYCSDAALGQIPGTEGTGAAELTNSHCPAASQLGTVTVGTGAGPLPFFVQTGKAYLAGPYKGAPLSLAILTPALAGPFDLGNVVVRTALRVDFETTQIKAVSDPLPTILDGIPLDLRDVRVNVNRNQFTLNPTSCDPMSVDATLSGTEGATANASDRFQVGECGRLAFKPKLSFSLKGKTNRGGHPQFSATLKMPEGGANIARAAVTLPHSEFLDQGHIKTICTRPQFAANQCPAGSVYGHAKAITPLLDQPLEGPVYLRSNPEHELPDLVADLRGQIHVVLAGRIDSPHGGIRNTFEVVPDAPVSKFTLTMQGGKKGLLQNSTNLCNSPNRAKVLFDGQNGKTADSTPPLKASGCGAKAHKHSHHRR